MGQLFLFIAPKERGIDRDSTRDQTERQMGVPPLPSAGHGPQETIPKRVPDPTGGSYNSRNPQGRGPAPLAPHLHDTSALRPLARPGPAEDEDDDGLHEEKEAAALQQQDSGGGAAAVGRPRGRAGGERRGRGRDCDRGSD